MDPEDADGRMFFFDEEVNSCYDIVVNSNDGEARVFRKEHLHPLVADAQNHSLDDDNDAVCTSTCAGHLCRTSRCGSNRGLNWFYDAEDDQCRAFFFDEEVGGGCDADTEGGGDGAEEEEDGEAIVLANELAEIFFLGD